MNNYVEVLLIAILVDLILLIDCQPKSFTPCGFDLQIIRHNCSLTCSVADSTKLTTFFKSGSVIGGCSGSCSSSCHRNSLKNEVNLLLINMSYSHAGKYFCSYGGGSKAVTIAVESNILNPGLVVNSGVQGLTSISFLCLTNHSRENLEYELRNKHGNVIENTDMKIDADNRIACEYKEESAYVVFVQMKKEYCIGIGNGEHKFSVRFILGQQEKVIDLFYKCEGIKGRTIAGRIHAVVGGIFGAVVFTILIIWTMVAVVGMRKIQNTGKMLMQLLLFFKF